MFLALFASGDSISEGAGWATAVTASSIMGWLLFKHIPELMAFIKDTPTTIGKLLETFKSEARESRAGFAQEMHSERARCDQQLTEERARADARHAELLEALEAKHAENQTSIQQARHRITSLATATELLIGILESRGDLGAFKRKPVVESGDTDDPTREG